MSVEARRGGVRKQVALPWNKSIEFAYKSVKTRFGRSMVTAGGVFLGIAFLASVLISKAIAGSNIEPGESARLNWLVGLSLAVCVVGITNAMLMSVTERFREIGTMKCLGALDGFVVRIFMLEAVAMGFMASVMGWTVGTLLMVLTKFLVGVPKNAPPGTVWYGSLDWLDLFGVWPVGSFWFCVILGAGLTALATFIPARQAANIPPAAALRTDV
ncbi:MAG: FtsX-like permease family protein [bacterium]|jgi:predicted lysophospholipase L1 biosynthesis ABC-type transport system permease subunit